MAFWDIFGAGIFTGTLAGLVIGWPLFCATTRIMLIRRHRIDQAQQRVDNRAALESIRAGRRAQHIGVAR